MKLMNYSSEFQILNYIIISFIHLKYSYFNFFQISAFFPFHFLLDNFSSQLFFCWFFHLLLKIVSTPFWRKEE